MLGQTHTHINHIQSPHHLVYQIAAIIFMVNRCVFLGNMFFFVGQIQREKQHRNQLGLLSSKKSGRSLRRRPPSIISSKHGSSYWCVLRREWGNDPSHHYIVMSSSQQPPATHPFPTFSTSKSWMFPEGGLERGCGHNWIKSMKWTVLVGGLEHLFFSHSVGNVIIPTDELHHFSEGLKPPNGVLYGSCSNLQSQPPSCKFTKCISTH